jgi:hypothetical protein
MPQATNPIETLAGCMAHAAYEAFPEYKYKDRNWAKYRKWQDEVFNKLSQDEKKKLYDEERRTGVHMGPPDTTVEKSRKHTFYDLTVYSMFSQTWGSTALGFGGAGGQAISSAYVCVIESNLVGGYAVYFGGRLAYVIDRPNELFIEHVARQRMVDAKLGKATYERTN